MINTHHTTFSLRSADGTRLFAREWRPLAEPLAWVTMSHGTSEHSGRYEPLAAVLNAAGFAVVMADLRGSGQSDGRRGHVDRFSQYTDDLRAAMAHTQSRAPKAHFLAGHSLGGLIAARIAVENPPELSGLLLSSAAFQLGFEPAAWKRLASRLLARLWPTLAIANDIDVADLSRDPSVGVAQGRDPYNHGRVTPGMYRAFLQAQQEVAELAPQLRMPVLAMHGGADKVSAPQGTEAFYHALTSRDKQLKIYRGMYHEIFNEIDRERVFADVVHWLQQRLSQRAIGESAVPA
ncbi:lysophospholipase [Spongiibacter sp.]|uniref:alpha/beta hydrolase n=1 Tax=Spongiibacter sp. TaxID=2024860 RepID=UPI00356740C1